MKEKIKKGYDRQQWLALCSNVVDFLTIFGSIFILITWAVLCYNVACFSSFVCLMTIGVCKLVIKLISYSLKNRK